MNNKNIHLFHIIFLLLSVSLLIGQQNQYSSGRYALELIKHYLVHEEYDLALQVAEKDFPETDYPDSLAWLIAPVYKIKNEPIKAAEQYSIVITHTADTLLAHKAVTKLRPILSQLSVRTSIELMVQTLEHVTSDQIYLELILILADIYEKNYLFTEANDIYSNLIDNKYTISNQELYIRIATNNVFQKKYKEAIKYADIVEAQEDTTHLAQALFIKYLGFDAQDMKDEALYPLLKLYLNYPEFASIFEINLNLVELLELNKEWLPAWYILENYYPQADKLEKKIIEKEIKEIKSKIQLEPNNSTFFRYFNPDFSRILKEN